MSKNVVNCNSVTVELPKCDSIPVLTLTFDLPTCGYYFEVLYDTIYSIDLRGKLLHRLPMLKP